MGFLGGNIIRKYRYLEDRELKYRLRKSGKFSEEEIEQVSLATHIPKADVIDILEVIYNPEMDHLEKVETLETAKLATGVLLFLATMPPITKKKR